MEKQARNETADPDDRDNKMDEADKKKKKKKTPKRVTLVTPKDTEELVGGGSGVGDVERNWRGVLIALLVILVVLSMILLSTVLLSPALLDPGAGARTRGPKIALADLLESGHKPPVPLSRPFVNNATWISETELIFRDSTGGVSIFNVENSTVRTLVSNSIFRQLDAVDFRVSSDLKFILLLVDVKKIYTNTREAYYHMFEIETMSRYPVHAGIGSPEESAAATGSSTSSAGVEPLQATLWSPHGSALAFVQSGDVYYCPGVGGGFYHQQKIPPAESPTSDAANGTSNHREAAEAHRQNGLRVIRLTDSGSVHVSNGVPDWIYQEEVFKSDSAIWFNPKGDTLAFIQFNDTLVGKVGYTRYTDIKQPYPPLRYLHYPKAWTTNPTVVLCIVNLTEPKLNDFKRIQQPKVVSSDGQAAYLTLVQWTSDRELLSVWTNRRQNISAYIVCSAPKWNCTTVYVYGAPEGSVVSLRPQVLSSGDAGDNRLATVVPILDGSNGHYEQACLLRRSPQGGGDSGSSRGQGGANRRSRIIPLTGGRMTVTRLIAWDSTAGSIYFEAAPGGRPAQRHLYRVGDQPTPRRKPPVCITCSADGGQTKHHQHTSDHHQSDHNNGPEHVHHWKELEIKQLMRNITEQLRPILSDDCLYVKTTFPPPAFNSTFSFKYYMLECLGPAVPTVHVMDARTHSRILILDSNSELSKRYSSMSTPQIKIFQVEVEGGYHAQVKLQLPPGLREYEDMAFPMVLRASFKPGEQCVDYRWFVDYASYLSSEKNFIVAEIDGRGSSGSGLAHMTQARLRLGNLDAQDLIAVVGYLRDNLKFVDRDKIGIFGSGYGGYLTGMILSQDTDIFHCGLSISGIYSWPHYNSVWTERWLATANVTDNLRGYEESDLTRRAGNLKDRRYLVIHGTGDLVANYQHPMLLSKALIQEGVLFRHLNYPDEGHDLGGVLEHLYKTLDAHWVDCFGELDFTDWELGSLDFSFKT